MGMMDNAKTGLINSIKNLLGRGSHDDIGGADGISPVKGGNTTEIGKHGDDGRGPGGDGTGTGDYYYKKMIIERTRKASYIDYDLMDAEHPELSSSLDVYADNCVAGEESEEQRFAIDSEDEKVKEVLTDINKRTRIDQELWPLTRDLCKYGDEFEEIIVNSAGLIVRLKALPQNEMFRNEDQYGLLLEERAFEQKDTATEKVLAKFEPWQIAHFRNRTSRKGQYGTSIFSPARRLFKQLQMMEDGMVIGRLSRSHMRYVYKIDVGEMAPAEAEAHVESVKRRIKKKRRLNPLTGKFDVISNPMSAEEDMFVGVRNGSPAGVDTLEGTSRLSAIKDVEYFQNKMFTIVKVPKSWLGLERDVNAKATLCLTGDTKIPLLDGRDVQIADLSKEYGNGEIFYVYSMDKDLNITIGVAHSPKLSIKMADVYTVTLDNGETVRATATHPFMKRDGTYCNAKDLKAGDSLMPLYRKLSDGKIKGYEMILDLKTEKYQYTHQMSALWKGYKKEHGYIIHHENVDKRNNAPDNLKKMNAQKHLDLHADSAREFLNTPEVIAKRNKSIRARFKNPDAKIRQAKNFEGGREKQIKACKSKKFRAIRSKQMKEQFKAVGSKILAWVKSSMCRQLASERMKKKFKDPVFKAAWIANNPKTRHDASIQHLIDTCKKHKCTCMKMLVKRSCYSELLVRRLLRDAEMTYPEFAAQHIEGGYKLCRTGLSGYTFGNRSVTNHKVVSVEYCGKEDVYDICVEEHHNFALSAGVFVHNSGQEVQFARTIRRIQHVSLKNGLKKIYDIGLLLQGYDLTKVQYEILFPAIKTIDEVRKWQIEKSKAEVAKIYGVDIDIITDNFILKYFLGLTDEEIKELSAEREVESEKAKKDAEAETAAQLKIAQAAIKAGGQPEESVVNLMRILNELKEVVAMELEGKKYRMLTGQ